MKKKILLYNTENYIQYFVINYNGKEYKKECIYVYNCHLAAQQKWVQYCKSATLIKKIHTID